jgi:deazaflavin-dependent oxidoreductase (nitroreductase family)
MRTTSDRRAPLPRAFARFNRKFANPVVRLVAGRLPQLAIIRHRGRRTGQVFATPVLAFGTSNRLVVGVLYGESSDWVRNVRLAGGAQVKRRGAIRDYGRPRLVGRDEAWQVVRRGPFRVLGVRSFLELTAMAPRDPSE